jgi:putative SOS response-associated peptidase YedK
MEWDVLAGQAKQAGRKVAQTNVRTLHLPQWRSLVSDPANRCLIPLTEFCEWAREPTDLGDGKKPIKGEMWFAVTDQPMFAIAGFWRQVGDQRYFAMVTCDANELVAPIHPKAMITILRPDDHARWLTGSYDDVLALQRPYPAAQMTVRGPVFPTRGNTPNA